MMEASSTTENSKRIAKNTIILYVRMIFLLGVSLYTSRVLLDVLGVEDYGIYNVVGGIVTMLGFFNGAMVSSTQRFFSFALGKKDNKQLSLNYSSILVIQIGLALLILFLAETLGLWLVKQYLVIPPDRMNAALWVFHFAVLTFAISVLQVPYTAMIITHEKMNAYAYISIADMLLKLIAVILLPNLRPDKLKSYAILLFIVAIISFVVYFMYCRFKFKHIKYLKAKDKSLFKTLLSYMGWNLWGNAAAVIMNHGVNILINIFFGPAVNAARAIAYQVQSAVNQLVTNFQLAMNPQIVKSYAADEISYMHSLIIRGAKLSFFLIFALALPVALEAQFFLSIWLTQVPPYAVSFTRLVLILACIDSFSGSLMTAAQASGKIKVYQSVVGGLLILNLPISYVVLRLGASPETTMYVAIAISIIALFTRLKITTPLVDLKSVIFLKNVILPSLFVATSSILFAIGAQQYLPSNQLKPILIASISIVVALFFMVTIGLTKSERVFFKNKFFSKKS